MYNNQGRRRRPPLAHTPAPVLARRAYQTWTTLLQYGARSKLTTRRGVPRSRLNAHRKHGVGTQTTLPQRPRQHLMPRDQPSCARPCQTKAVAARLRGGQAMALCTGPFTVNFAVQMQFKTHCEPDTTVAPLLCVAYELVRRARGWRRHTAYHAHTPMPPAPNMGPEVLARPN